MNDPNEQYSRRHLGYARLLTRHYVRAWTNAPLVGSREGTCETADLFAPSLAFILAEVDETQRCNSHLLTKVLDADPPGHRVLGGVRPKSLVLSFLAEEVVPRAADNSLQWPGTNGPGADETRYYLEEAAKPNPYHDHEGRQVASYLIASHDGWLDRVAEETLTSREPIPAA